MSYGIKRRIETETEPVRVLGRGLRAQRGVHLTVRTLREAAGKTQVDDCQVSTLQRYVAALGGRLELVATFGNKKIVLTGAQTERG